MASIAEALEELTYTAFYRDDVKFYSYFASPYVPIVSVMIYLFLTKSIFEFIRSVLKLKSKGPVIQSITILHSFALAVYSGWTAYYTIPLVLKFISANQGGLQGLTAAVCDINGILWNEYDFKFWATHFYISKFYEFIDTSIIVLKGRKPSVLQTFHHAGIVLMMYGFVVSSASVVLIVVCFNSVIHTLMYSYYVLAAFGVRSALKSYLTQLQIIQFLLGVSISIPYQFVPGCLKKSQSIALGITQIYTFILIALFVSFYVNTYSNRKSEKSK